MDSAPQQPETTMLAAHSLSDAPNSVKAAMLPEYAYLETGTQWGSSDWPKNMLLLFDGIAVLLPEQERDRFRAHDEAVIAGLEQHKVLHFVRPESVVDRQACDAIVNTTLTLLESPKVAELAGFGQSVEFYFSKFGSAVDPQLVNDLLVELQTRKLAAPLFSGNLVAVHPVLAVLILAEIGKHVVRYGADNGMDLHPSTDRAELHQRLRECGSTIDVSNTTKVIASDFEAAGIELGPIPVDEIIAFRKEHRDLLNRYRLGLIECVEDLARRGMRFEETLLKERREKFEADKGALDKFYREWLRSKARLGIGFVGAVSNAALHNYVGVGTNFANALTQSSGTSPPRVTRMSFLLAAGQRFGNI